MKRQGQQKVSLEELEKYFKYIETHTSRAILFYEKLECEKQNNKQMILDAICMNLIRIGEGVNKIVKIQSSFWSEFCETHFIELNDIRNDLAHMRELKIETQNQLKNKLNKVKKSLENTFFDKKNRGQENFGIPIPTKKFYDLPSSKEGGQASLENSMAIITMDDNKFVIRRLSRSDNNKLLITSSKAESIPIKIYGRKQKP